MKNTLLTDFNSELWNGISTEKVTKLLYELNKAKVIYGEIGKSKSMSSNLTKISHTIRNIVFIDNKIYGDVEFIKNNNGRQAELIYQKNKKFEIRANAIRNNNKYTISEIITWDILS